MKITAKGAGKDFIRQSAGTNRFTAVRPTDIEIEPGKLTLLMGRSGSGKSTLLNILSGLLPPTTGKVLYGNDDIYAFDDVKLSDFRNLHIGVIPQGQTAIQSLDVIGNICLPYMLKRDTELKSAYPYARELMERLGISHLESVMPAELSGGELRRVTIARAMIRKPDVIFADEPTCDLDDENTALVLGLLKETAERGTSVFIVTHEKDALAYADISYRMDSGKISPEKPNR